MQQRSPQAGATSIAMHRSSWLYSSETPAEVQVAIFGLPDCSVVSEWLNCRSLISAQPSAFWGCICTCSLTETIYARTSSRAKTLLSFLQGSKPHVVICPLWLQSIRFDCSSKCKDELCCFIFIPFPTCVALLLHMSSPSWKYIYHHVLVLLVLTLSRHLDVLQNVPNLS